MDPIALNVLERFITGRRTVTAGLGDDLTEKIERLLNSEVIDDQDAKAVGKWLVDNFHFNVAKTPKGGKEFKAKLDMIWWTLKNGFSGGNQGQKSNLVRDWADIKGKVPEIVRLFTDEGGRIVPKELKLNGNTYLNVSGFTEDQLKKFAESLEDVFKEIKGWRRKALAGGLEVVLAGPGDFHGTSSGKYRSEQDQLYVKATPAILKRSRGTYAAFDYIMVHELGHRYQFKRHPKMDFDKPEWWTSKYSRTEGESFAELFAISNYNLTGPWDQKVVGKFEEFMESGKVPESEPVELPDHLRSLVRKAMQSINP